MVPRAGMACPTLTRLAQGEPPGVMVAKISHSPEDRKPLEPGQLGCRVWARQIWHPAMASGHLYCLKANVPRCGKRAQSQLRENKKRERWFDKRRPTGNTPSSSRRWPFPSGPRCNEYRGPLFCARGFLSRTTCTSVVYSGA